MNTFRDLNVLFCDCSVNMQQYERAHDVDPKRAESTYKEGVLTIKLPLKEPITTTKIPVK